jgi:sugar phosphate isomerase/epimerase
MPLPIRRSEFIASLAGAGFFAATPRWPFFALCMDTHDARKRNLAEQASMVHELGYAGAGHLWFENVAERLRTLDGEGLRLFQIYSRLDISSGAKDPFDPKLFAVLPLLRGRDVTLAFLTGGRKPSDEAGDARAVDLIRDVAAYAADHGVRVALYPHVKDWTERVEDALRVTRKVDRPNVGVMFNLCHWMKSGDEAGLEALLAAAKPHLMAVSINGSDTVAEVKSGKGNWIQPLDAGSYDMLGFLRILARAGYRGPVGLQCYGIPGDARDHLARSMAAWRSLNQRLGRI